MHYILRPIYGVFLVGQKILNCSVFARFSTCNVHNSFDESILKVLVCPVSRKPLRWATEQGEHYIYIVRLVQTFFFNSRVESWKSINVYDVLIFLLGMTKTKVNWFVMKVELLIPLLKEYLILYHRMQG